MENKPSILSKFEAKIWYNTTMRLFARIFHEPRGPNVFTVNAFGKSHYFSLLLCMSIMGLNFYSGMLVSKTRAETFKRNYAVLERHFT